MIHKRSHKEIRQDAKRHFEGLAAKTPDIKVRERFKRPAYQNKQRLEDDMRRKLKQAERQQIYQKCQGHCAYCGSELQYKNMQVDGEERKACYENKRI